MGSKLMALIDLDVSCIFVSRSKMPWELSNMEVGASLGYLRVDQVKFCFANSCLFCKFIYY